jgi:ABC-type maltose transport system permease subunit
MRLDFMDTRTANAPAQISLTERIMKPHVRGIIIRQIFIQLFLLLVTAIVLFPVVWIISMAIDPRGVARPTDLNLFPANANLDAFERLLTQPFSNVLPLGFTQMLVNSLFIALGTSLFTVGLGSSAAYAFSRFKFIGRQAGMLGFIILLMLPATGIIIPLFILFTSIKINSTLAAAPPAFFTGGLWALIIFVIYSLVKGYGKTEPDRTVNPSPQVITAVTALLAFFAIALVFYIMLLRNDTYNSVVRQPLRSAESAYNAVNAEYQQRLGSVAQRDQTARTREARAENAATEAQIMTALRDTAQETEFSDDFLSQLKGEIEKREDGSDPDGDMVLQALLMAQIALDNGDTEGAMAVLDEGVVNTLAEAESRQQSAASARNNVVEAQAALDTITASRTEALTALEAEQDRLGSIRWDAMGKVIPRILLAWVGALAGAALIWWVLNAVREHIEVPTVLNILLWATLGAVTIGIGLIALDERVGNRGGQTETLRTTLLGLSIAFASGGLPFAIWNLKGYFDTIPKELEEAALIDGAGRIGTFFRIIVPLALPAFAIVILFSFMQGWTEFILSWVFLTGKTQDYTLAMALATLAGGSNQPPPDMQKFAALSILISMPVLVLFFAFQRWIVSGLSIGGVKG